MALNANVQKPPRQKLQFSKKGVLRVGAVLLLLILIFSCTVIIPAGHTGVVSVFGQVSSNVLQEGFHFKLPWQSVNKMDNRVVKLEVSTEAFSSDLQTVNTTLAVNYRLNTDMSYSIYKNVGTKYEDTLVTPAVNEVLKAIIAKYTAEQSITNRSVISGALIQGLNAKLQDEGLTVTDVNIIDFDFSETYISAIEAKQVAEQTYQKAKTEQNQLTMEKQAEAERRVIEAEASLEVAKIDAEAVEFAGQKEAAANQAIASSLSPLFVEYYKLQQWDGKLPTVSGGNSIITIPMGD